MKKTFKIIGIALAVIIIALIAAPFLFKGSLENMLKRTINENLNATVSWEKLDLSLLRSFPDASLQVKNFSVINKAPFEGDTLASGKSLSLDMGIMQLFKSEDLLIDAIRIDGALLNIKVDSLDNANYDIVLSDESESETASESSFKMALDVYEIKNSEIRYFDEAQQMSFVLTDFQHSGKGDLSESISKLDTKTETLASFSMDGTEYLTKHKVSLDAILEIDLENQKYSFLDNEGKINDLPLVFNGYVQLNEDNTEVDLSFKTPSSDFKNFLAIIPEEYVKQISDVKTTGDFVVDGKLKGIIDEEHIPTIDVQITSNNASFKYPDLPKSVDNITIDASVKNETGLVKDTYVNIPRMTFTIDNEAFSLNGNIRNFTENPLVNLAVRGSLNLAHIEDVLPLELDQDLSGIFKADITANFDMESADKEQYQNIKLNGNASLTDFTYDAGFNNNFEIKNASLTGQPGLITLKELNAKTGQTDFRASGNIQNLLSFLMGKQDLKGRFTVNSNTFNINDFMVPESEVTEQTKSASGSLTEEVIKIPSFLDATLDFVIQTVIYDDIALKNAKGTAAIQDETISIRNFTSDIFGGGLALSGNVSTKSATPVFAMNLDLSSIDIDQSFEGLDMLKFLVPIAKAMQGNLDITFDLSGSLTNDFTPDLATLGGSAMAKILTADLDSKKTPLLAALGEQVSFLNLDQLKLNNLTTNFSFENGRIDVKPFDLDFRGIHVDVNGSHGLDKSIQYALNMDVPAKLLGKEVTNLLKDLTEEEADNMMLNLPVDIKGSFDNPQISVNTKAAVEELTREILAKQKEDLIDKGKGILGDLLNNKTKKDTTKTKKIEVDSTQTKTETQKDKTEQRREETTEKIKGALEGIFGNKKKKGAE